MKTAAIVLDNWKLDTYKRMLDELGYSYTEHEGVTVDTTCLRVKTNNLQLFTSHVQNMESVAQREKRRLN